MQFAFIFLYGRKMLKIGRWSDVKYLKNLSFVINCWLETVISISGLIVAEKSVQFKSFYCTGIEIV